MTTSPNFTIFSRGDDLWDVITNCGERPVPPSVSCDVICGGAYIDFRKHPIITIEKDAKWIINYSQTL
jgi:hypothetical protein